MSVPASPVDLRLDSFQDQLRDLFNAQQHASNERMEMQNRQEAGQQRTETLLNQLLQAQVVRDAAHVVRDAPPSADAGAGTYFGAGHTPVPDPTTPHTSTSADIFGSAFGQPQTPDPSAPSHQRRESGFDRQQR
jgi:hypothetical protein